MTASFLAIFILLSSFVLWGGVGWGGIITSCLSAFHTYLPHGRHCLLGGEGWGGVGWDINVIFECWKLTSKTLLMLRPSRRQVSSKTLLMLRSSRLQISSRRS